MTHQESILAYLEQRGIQLCDDCLGHELGIQPRQTVNQVCRSLANQGVICRSKNRCNQCRKAKLVNRMAPRGRESRQVPALGLTPESLRRLNYRRPAGNPAMIGEGTE